jgi:hypothetical protein
LANPISSFLNHHGENYLIQVPGQGLVQELLLAFVVQL